MYIGIFDETRVTKFNLKGNNSILIRVFNNKEENYLIINKLCYKFILELYI